MSKAYFAVTISVHFAATEPTTTSSEYLTTMVAWHPDFPKKMQFGYNAISFKENFWVLKKDKLKSIYVTVGLISKIRYSIAKNVKKRKQIP